MRKFPLHIILYSLFMAVLGLSTQLYAQDNEVVSEQQGDGSGADSDKPAKVSTSRVSVLGYHDFSATKSATQMLLPNNTFRKQLQAIRDQGLNVISLDEFIAWKRGEQDIPDQSILITIDDGWKTVYTEAFPILKEFGYPFTVYLYKNYVDGGGRALTTAMIKEMMEHGCTIGCHSTSHPLRSKVNKYKNQGEAAFDRFLNVEMLDSKTFLEEKFDVKVTTYAYPGGIHTEEMHRKAEELKYDCLFTVFPGKITIGKDNNALPRYIVLGTHDSIFEQAISFRSRNADGTLAPKVIKLAHPVLPKPGDKISDRMPVMEVDVSNVEGLNPDSIVMRVYGFGKVPCVYDGEKKVIRWKANRAIRQSVCTVTAQWQLVGSTKYEPLLKWSFQIDRSSVYQPRTAPVLPSGTKTPVTSETENDAIESQIEESGVEQVNQEEAASAETVPEGVTSESSHTGAEE